MYVLFHYFTHTATIVFTIYSVALFFLLLQATALFSSPHFNFKLFFIGIAGIATIESVYCLWQFFGIFKSQSKHFAVSGSWNNPNVTAIFLALTVPVFLYLFRSKYKKIVLTGFLAVLFSLALLKCRAAYIGAFLSVIVFYGLEYQFINWIKNQRNSTSAKALLILSLLIIIPTSSHLYNSKKASSEGRKFIWKLSTQMAIQKPILGYGYGHFEKEYNLYQANYIQNNKATTEELANAGPVIMPHNEIIQNVVEGGSVGLVLIILFFGSLLLTIKQRKKTDSNPPNLKTENRHFHLAYSGIVGFIGMSMVNSTMQIVPIMCLLVVYAAIVCSGIEHLTPSPSPEDCFIPRNDRGAELPYLSILSKTIIIAISLYLLYLLFGMATADRQNKKAKILQESGQYQQALQMMPALESHLKQDSHYWENYGSIYFETQQYQAALDCFKKARTLSTLPEIYYATGSCYQKLQRYPQAIQEYETLVALYPSKFLYKMLLLETYLKNKEVPKAIALAEYIVDLQPKVPSEKVERYKKMCRGIVPHPSPPRRGGSRNWRVGVNTINKQKSIYAP